MEYRILQKNGGFYPQSKGSWWPFWREAFYIYLGAGHFAKASFDTLEGAREQLRLFLDTEEKNKICKSHPY